MLVLRRVGHWFDWWLDVEVFNNRGTVELEGGSVF